MNTVRLNDLRNIEKLCRVCLTESRKMIRLTEELDEVIEPNIKTVWNLMQKVIPSKIVFDNKYPSLICPMCLGLLKISYKFRLQFESSQKLVYDYFGESSIVTNGDESEVASVELILKDNKYDLSNVLIVEDVNEERHNFDGFLKNLGTEVSATFVTSGAKHKQNIQTKFEYVLEECDDKVQDLREKNEETKFKCVLCFEDFRSRSDLKRHEADHSKDHDTYVCEVCGIISKSRSSQYHHMLKHSGKQHKCPYCSKKYFNSSNVHKHIVAVHQNNRPHLCTVCGKSFNYANAFDYHMRIHKNERKYKCTYCEKSFIMQCGLSRHLRIHTGVRPYICTFCQRGFRSKGELDCHIMTHTGFRPYHCKYCSKGFTKSHNLKMHLLQHPGQHACYICKKTFAEINCLKLHYKLAHNKQDKKENGVVPYEIV